MHPKTIEPQLVDPKGKPSPSGGLSDLMRIHWDERARTKPLHYIADWKADWSTDEFLASGEEDYLRLAEPIFRKLGFDPHDRSVADVGCGAGRVTRAFARRFGQVYALDVSPEMLSLARTLGPNPCNVEWVLSSGTDLQILPSASVDCVFSYLVLQHIPRQDMALRLIAEIFRILKVGGVFLFQFVSQGAPYMNLKGRAVWWVLDRLRDRGPGTLTDRIARVIAPLLRLDPLAGGHTWRGAILEPQPVLEAVWANGGAVAGLNGLGTQFSWCYGWKM